MDKNKKKIFYLICISILLFFSMACRIGQLIDWAQGNHEEVSGPWEAGTSETQIARATENSNQPDPLATQDSGGTTPHTLADIAGSYNGRTDIPELRLSNFPADTLQSNEILIDIHEDGSVSGMVNVIYRNVPTPNTCVADLCCHIATDVDFTGEIYGQIAGPSDEIFIDPDFVPQPYGEISRPTGTIQVRYSIIDTYIFQDPGLCTDNPSNWIREYDYAADIIIMENALFGDMTGGEIVDGFDFTADRQ